MWPGRLWANGLMHVVITPSPYSENASTECGINYRWKGRLGVDHGPPTCFECWRITLRRGT